ncbi:hypothetical protein C7T94_04210 [Pedobacter yulinensis]|uniref:Uncharacterized protein n=1 Tax=Pedobacter yulinensis TaxID=2126353 RepID=A0A2T3HND4_9SPHI|nr:hypothetical protein C7T94_04210 [Pedobacter yulinensis]
MLLALDTSRLQLKKIVRADTITLASTGKVWYKRLQDRIEFYTRPGYHPVYPEMELKPITAYIIERHCGKQAGRPALASR